MARETFCLFNVQEYVSIILSKRIVSPCIDPILRDVVLSKDMCVYYMTSLRHCPDFAETTSKYHLSKPFLFFVSLLHVTR